MVMLGLANSRMKDFYDIGVIAHTMPLEGIILAQAVRATFVCRNTETSAESLYVFSDYFKNDKDKKIQWKAFLNKNNLNNNTEFNHIVDEVQQLLEPVYQSVANQGAYEMHWLPDDFHWKK
ncbi:MAG: nucleotidyl transferase AbiEii/AbiGii toxin family protein [Ectothiorhodospiraceae bacterium]|nr:nucleotidyl transferase AbiEii/AbiGii toxin family protein [Ectothiorhodospiraceae bacterium]